MSPSTHGIHGSPFDESVYRIIPVEHRVPPKPPLYHSKYSEEVREKFKIPKKPHAIMGPERPDGSAISPDNFLRKGEGDRRLDAKAASGKGERDRTVRKASLPSDNGRLASATNRDFVKLNALDNINSTPKKVPVPAQRFTNKKDYGRNPEYLDKRKKDSEVAQKMLSEARAHQQQQEALSTGLLPLPEDERLKILEGLRMNWSKLNEEYGKLSLTVDTIPKITRKVSIEQRLKRLETDIAKFSHPNILVDVSGGAR
ncbi:hypothetical protein M427DRAFT_125218 [Gonapodya prolifera JEL478]|uniref:Enkurin domain-containing protein n=1 Tax=Gonapodya prolifera (strain JEL478) TaxID=1344416 RepID=A0A139A9V2_GONPJ|nr:hypothetical protein M427DRAFT_125218 [Gonapodya prolifera JEL478]|eukprot:KXS13265.1 hypothetical protein M427DRAFT_125218 [Gonapodya prolifera JEL478]